MNNSEFSSISPNFLTQIRLFICLTLLLISKWTDVVANTTPDELPRRRTLLSFSTAPETKYDVFVSFRGREIRDNFLSHVLMALSRKKVVAYSDKKLTTGEEISVLHAAIERSTISLVIFSPNFASSRWCLDELVKIVECRRNFGRILLPVFYHVDPSDVRSQRGTYNDSLIEHEKNCNLKKVQTWRSALKESANISGIESSKFSDDAKLVEEIVKGVLNKLNQEQQVNSKGLVGIEKPISHIESLLHLELEDVRALGIWGMAGIGKTTIAEEVFNRLRSGYESYCYIPGVREQLERYGAESLVLRKRLLSTLLDDEDLTDDIKNGLPPFVEKRLRRMKVLIFLDDVKEPRQLEVLVGTLDWLGPGSRIIITARDKQVLAKKVNDIYEVEALGFDESLQLFNWHAFGEQNHLAMEYIELSKTMVNYANGFPLVIKALAHHLYGKDKRIWEIQAKNLKREQIEGVHDVFHLIYNYLDHYEKQIFLDIACFFDGLNLRVDLIKVLLKDHYYSIDTKLDRMKDKALVTISQHDIVSMHDILQETGWEIVRQESIEEPGRRSRLLDPKDIYRVLKDDKGSETIRSIVIKPDTIKELQQLSPQVFAKMSKLKFLDIYTKESQNEVGLYLPQGLEYLPNELRYLRWTYYPLEYLPSEFSAENLVILFLPFSRLKKLWHEEKEIVDLNVLILRSSTHLTELPNLSKATNLRILDLSGCISLTRLESNIHFSSLSLLSLRNCSSLKDFSITSENMKLLNLELTGIKQLPSSFGHQTELEILLLGHTYIKNLPESIKKLTKLRHLHLHNCKELQTLPELPPSLEILDVSDCVSLENVMFPSNIAIQKHQENKKRVTFWNCLKLDEDSLEAIELNAKINMMNFAYKHLSTSDHEHDTQGMYVYPGNKVPEWLEYSTTTHDYITIDLSSTPYFPQLGFIFCFIIPAIPSEGLALKFKISVDDGEGSEDGVRVYLDRPRHGIESVHVYLMYDTACSHYLASRANDQSKIQIMVRATSRTGASPYVPVQLRGFGISLVYPSRFQEFIQQLESAQRIPNNMCPI